MKRLSRFIQAVTEHFVALVLFSALSAAVLWAGSRVLLLSIPWETLNSISFNVGFILVLFFFIATILLLVRRNRPSFDPINHDFRTLRKDISITYETREAARYTRKYRLRALRNDIEMFNDFYCWTGSRVKSMKCANSRHRIYPTGTRGPYNRITINLGAPLRKGEEIDIEIIWELEDSERIAKPFISTLVNHPTDLLSFEVHMFKGGADKEVVCETSPTSAADRNVVPVTKAFGDDWVVRWEISAPRLLHHYELRWGGEQWP